MSSRQIPLNVPPVMHGAVPPSAEAGVSFLIWILVVALVVVIALVLYNVGCYLLHTLHKWYHNKYQPMYDQQRQQSMYQNQNYPPPPQPEPPKYAY